MKEKIQEIIEKVYRQGLKKGRGVGEHYLNKDEAVKAILELNESLEEQRVRAKQRVLQERDEALAELRKVGETLNNLLIAQNERWNIKYSATGIPEFGPWLWDAARQALSSPLMKKVLESGGKP